MPLGMHGKSLDLELWIAGLPLYLKNKVFAHPSGGPIIQYLKRYSFMFFKPQALIAALLISTGAFADTYTYEFVAPAYTSTYNNITYGSAAVFDFTFDNGQNTNSNQSYTWGDITAIEAKTVGGSFDVTVTPTTNNYGWYISVLSEILLTTSGNGSGNFQFPQYPQSSNGITVSLNQFGAPLAQFFTIENWASGSLFITYQTVLGDHFTSYAESLLQNQSVNQTYPALFVSQSPSSPIPLPGAIWLFGSALAVFTAFNRRKSMQRD